MIARSLTAAAFPAFAIACSAGPRWFGNDAGLAPVVPWQDFTTDSFVVDVPRPAHVAVFRLAQFGTAQPVRLLYVDSAVAPQLAVEVGLPASSTVSHAPAAPPVPRMVWRCIESGHDRGDSQQRQYRWGCGWVTETPDIKVPPARRADAVFGNYYIVVAYDAPRSAEELAAAAQAVRWSRSSHTMVRALGAALFADAAGAHWAATLQPIR